MVLAVDRVFSIDTAASLLVVDDDGKLKVYRVKPFTEITVNGAKGVLADLRPGMDVSLKLADSQTASTIAATGLVTATADPPKSKPFYERDNAAASIRQISIKARIDGTDKFIYRDGRLWIEHLKAKPPDMIQVNGIDWTPIWNGDTADPFTDFRPPPAPIGRSRVKLKQMAGRAKATMETETGGKFENVPTVLIDDSAVAADTYEIQLLW